MRRIWILFPLLAVVSCISKSPKSNDDEIIKKRLPYTAKDSLGEYSFQSLIETKFEEFYNLNVLLKNYPDFKKDIENRLENFTSGTRKIFHINDSIQVVNIRQNGPFVKISDSTEMTHVLFDIVSDHQTKTDTVVAFITKKKAHIDNKEVTSTKVKFTRVLVAQF